MPSRHEVVSPYKDSLLIMFGQSLEGEIRDVSVDLADGLQPQAIGLWSVCFVVDDTAPGSGEGNHE